MSKFIREFKYRDSKNFIILSYLWLHDKFDDYIYYPIYRVCKGIKNIIQFSKIIYQYRSWDYCYFYDIIIFILKDMENYHKKYSHTTKEYRDKKVRKMLICRTLLKRINENDYCRQELSRYLDKYPMKWSEPFIENGEEFYTLLSPPPEADKEYKRYHKKVELLKKHDWELFCKYFKQSECFWD